MDWAMGGDDRFDVFLSYALSDALVATALNAWLCADGVRTFLDRASFVRSLLEPSP
jgi:hypothetical protein